MKNLHNRYILDGTLSLASLDLFAYTIADTLGFQGDWHMVSKSWDIPVWSLVPIGAAVYWGLSKYHQRWAEQRPPEQLIQNTSSGQASILRWPLQKPAPGRWTPMIGHNPLRNEWSIGFKR